MGKGELTFTECLLYRHCTQLWSLISFTSDSEPIILILNMSKVRPQGVPNAFCVAGFKIPALKSCCTLTTSWQGAGDRSSVHLELLSVCKRGIITGTCLARVSRGLNEITGEAPTTVSNGTSTESLPSRITWVGGRAHTHSSPPDPRLSLSLEKES